MKVFDNDKRGLPGWQQEGGFTLVEMMLSLTLLVVVLGMISSVTIFGLRSYHEVRIENSLREEGDLLMSSIMTAMYEFGPELVEYSQDQGSSGASSLLLERDENGQKEWREIRIDQNGLYIRDVADGKPASTEQGRIDIDSTIVTGGTDASAIQLDCQGRTACSSGLISVNLDLMQTYNGKAFPLKLQSKFGF
ncbi:prepilin-type N-terminal cleavage/methylation domain-containing protein [Paenibacillus sp. JX-17]|uniref:Prepilin-type N-terminal cleavage/methylation domain-containing protein n=1 Tax=Paenibacillus lacisoli TaxID=3064525 RepID=A0ABT9CBE5_9BACL|nr:prepilin-type N-terminal cleavage/methylation domain-containing protein [Paenibacillus sp. JX-17]MDO7906589.1 prepilin-type N-terminal cleavage/methylation domain-containing protein [Paenibacillus sp. JX-17]